jgi:hypothetical protein
MSDSGQQVGATIRPSARGNASSIEQASYAVPSLTGFGEDGAAEYHEFVSKYLIALEQVSRASARNRESEVVSPFDVRVAASSLRGFGNNKTKHADEIGTLLIGASLAYLGSVIYGSNYTWGNALLIFLPLLIGGILYAYSWNRG